MQRSLGNSSTMWSGTAQAKPKAVPSFASASACTPNAWFTRTAATKARSSSSSRNFQLHARRPGGFLSSLSDFNQFSEVYKQVVDFREEVLGTVQGAQPGNAWGRPPQGIICVEDYELLPFLEEEWALASSQPFLKGLGSEIFMAKRWMIGSEQQEYKHFFVYELLKTAAKLQVGPFLV